MLHRAERNQGEHSSVQYHEDEGCQEGIIYSERSIIIHFYSQKFDVGYCFMLPKTVPGSVDFYKENFEKAMAIIQKVNFSLNSLLKCAFQTGKPDLFITFTGNPQWKEIQVRVSLFSNLQSV